MPDKGVDGTFSIVEQFDLFIYCFLHTIIHIDIVKHMRVVREKTLQLKNIMLQFRRYSVYFVVSGDDIVYTLLKNSSATWCYNVYTALKSVIKKRFT